MSEVSARLPSDPQSGQRPHTLHRQVKPGFQSSVSLPRSVLAGGLGLEFRNGTPLSSNRCLKEIRGSR